MATSGHGNTHQLPAGGRHACQGYASPRLTEVPAAAAAGVSARMQECASMVLATQVGFGCLWVSITRLNAAHHAWLSSNEAAAINTVQAREEFVLQL